MRALIRLRVGKEGNSWSFTGADSLLRGPKCVEWAEARTAGVRGGGWTTLEHGGCGLFLVCI